MIVYIHEFFAFGKPNVVHSLVKTKTDSTGYSIDAYEIAEQLYAQMLGWA